MKKCLTLLLCRSTALKLAAFFNERMTNESTVDDPCDRAGYQQELMVSGAERPRAMETFTQRANRRRLLNQQQQRMK